MSEAMTPAPPDLPGVYWVHVDGKDCLALYDGDLFTLRVGGTMFSASNLPWDYVDAIPETSVEIEFGGGE